MNNHDYHLTLVTTCGLILLMTLESWLPAVGNRHHRLRHAARNLTLGLLNALALALLAAPLIANVARWTEESRFGLLKLLSLPPWIATVTAILLFDGWMYLWHRANYELGFLWRFHRVHHSDPEMDVTTAVRFHTGEILISSALRLAVIPLLGITISQLLVYETLLLPVILFHHSNVRFPERVDRWLRLITITPAIHRIHHSRLRMETDSNYSSVFSFWDRIAGTFRLRRDGRPVDFGLNEFDGERWQRVKGVLCRLSFYLAEYPRSRELRRKVLLGLNKGELLNDLAHKLFFGGQGEMRDRTYAENFSFGSRCNTDMKSRLGPSDAFRQGINCVAGPELKM